MPCGLVQSIYFLDSKNQLIVAGKEGCYLIDMEIKFKYDATMAILLDAKGKSIMAKIKKPAKS